MTLVLSGLRVINNQTFPVFDGSRLAMISAVGGRGFVDRKRVSGRRESDDPSGHQRSIESVWLLPFPTLQAWKTMEHRLGPSGTSPLRKSRSRSSQASTVFLCSKLYRPLANFGLRMPPFCVSPSTEALDGLRPGC